MTDEQIMKILYGIQEYCNYHTIDSGLDEDCIDCEFCIDQERKICGIKRMAEVLADKPLLWDMPVIKDRLKEIS